jgi:hypothetical protein
MHYKAFGGVGTRSIWQFYRASKSINALIRPYGDT